MPDIDFQRIELNLIPKKGDEPVVFYASQYETARPFIADLMWGDTEFAPGGDCWAEIDIRKVDNNLVVITDEVTIDNNEVSVILPQQALTCVGKNFGQVKIYAADDQLVAALNFILEVQPDPLAGGVDSETAIDNLETQIDEIISGEGYLKSDDVAPVALSGSYNDLTDKPTIPDELSELTDVQITDPEYKDALFYDDVYEKWFNQPAYTKADIQTFYYDKTAVDTALSSKADADSVYTKAQVDGIIEGLLPDVTASGAIVDFNTAIVTRLSVTADENATVIYRNGIQQWDEEWENGQYDSSGLPSPNDNVIRSKNYIPVVGGQTYYFVSGGNWIYVCQYDSDKNFIGSREGFGGGTKTLLANCAYIRFNLSGSYGNTYNNDISINYPSTDTSYHAYVGESYAPDAAIYTLMGTNVVFSDYGDVSTICKDTIQHYIDERT